jgi:polyisoprenoid-binding protein YceI
VFKHCVVVVAAVLLAACGVPKPRDQAAHGVSPPAAGAGAAGAVPPAPAGRGVYLIDPSHSEIRLLVYRAGPMARLGHDHVITHRAVAGWIKFNGNPSAAVFALSLPVADFVIDSPAARAEEGTEFHEEVTEDAKAGTRHNMLSEALLDAEHYPTITLTSVSVTGTAGMMNATLVLHIAGHQSTLVVPFQVATATGQISASGAVQLRQTELGLKPFSTMLGALQVQDEFTVKFTLFATNG